MARATASSVPPRPAHEHCHDDRAHVRHSVTNGTAEWVNVGRGARVGDLIEVFGPLKDGDTIVRRGTDEIRQGSRVIAQPPKAS